MNHGFRRSRTGVKADLSRPERELLLSLLEQTMALLEGAAPPGTTGVPPTGDTGPGDRADDPGAAARAAAEPDEDSFESIMRRAGFTADGPGSESSAPAGQGTDPVVDDGGDGAGGGEPVAHAGRTDPAVRRLLPDAHADDPELAAEFRSLTGDSVRQRKVGHLRRAVGLVADSRGVLTLAEADAVSLLIALTDVRLVLGERLGLDDDEAAESLSQRIAEWDAEHPMFGLALGYEFLTWLQETLATALTP